jgi:hypothetical protein
MARISSYPVDQNIVGSDKVIGTDSTGAITKNYTLNGISSWMNAEGTIGIVGQNNFFFQTVNGEEGRLPGSISFEGYGGANTAFSAISTLRFSQESVADTIIINYLLTLVGRTVLLARLDNLNNFGVYKLVSLTQSVSEPNFYDAVFTLIVANGNLTADKYYGFAVYPELVAADKNYVFIQSTPSATWTITHNLGKFPSVSVVDSANTVVYGDINYINENSLTVTFSAAFGGKAYMN